jgi:hypothetical protein
MARIIDIPVNEADAFKALCRQMVVIDLLLGCSEDELYRRRIDVATQAARLEGCDESDVEVIAAQARRDVAEILAECRADGLDPETMGEGFADAY